MKSQLVAGVGLVATLLAIGCAGATEPATNVLNLSAQLNAKGYTNDGPATWWWEYDTVQSDLGTANDTEVCGVGTGPKEPDNRCGPATGGSSSSQIPLNVVVTGLTPSTTYYFRACGQDTNDADPTCANVRSFTTLAGTAYAFARTVGTSGTLGSGRTANIAGLAVDRDDNLYVADRATTTEPYARVQKFGPAGEFLTGWGSRGTGNGQFTGPDGIDVDAAGRVYTIEREDPRVQVFTSGGAFLRKFGGYRPAGTGEFWLPTDLAVTPDGAVYASDSIQRLQLYDTQGAFVLAFGDAPGDGTPGDVTSPSDVARDTTGNVYAANTNFNRIEKFNSAGGFLLNWGSAGAQNGQFSVPVGVATDKANAVYAVDRDTNRVQKFTSSGGFITAFTSPNPNQQPGLDHVVVDSRGLVYAAEEPNNRIVVFRPTQ